MSFIRASLLGLAVLGTTAATAPANTLDPNILAQYLRPLTQAEKASLPRYKAQYVEMTLRHTDTTFRDGFVMSLDETEEDFGGEFQSLSSLDDPWGIPLPRAIAPGAERTFSALLYSEYGPSGWLESVNLLQCDFEQIGCDNYLGGYTTDGWDFSYWYEIGADRFTFTAGDDTIAGELKPGGRFSYDSWYGWDTLDFTTRDGKPAQVWLTAWALNFEVVDYRTVTAGNWNYVPTVPAPATALLLPMGLLALAAFRRRA